MHMLGSYMSEVYSVSISLTACDAYLIIPLPFSHNIITTDKWCEYTDYFGLAVSAISLAAGECFYWI